VTALVAADLRNRWRGLAGVAAGSFVVLVVLAGTYSAYGGAAGFAKSFGSGHTPRLLSAFSGSASGDIFSPGHFLAFGFGHPLFLVLGLSVAVTSGVAAVAGDVETGRTELLYTGPIRRTAVLDARIAGWALAQTGVIAAGVAGAMLGTRFSTDLSGVSLAVPVRAGVQFAALALFVAAVSFTASARMHSRGAALGLAVGITAGSYLANLVALLWTPLALLRHFEPFGYYSPTGATGGVDWSNVGVLAFASVVLFGIARYSLSRRDLA
jgi:putative exporter of polyketide antibiotics